MKTFENFNIENTQYNLFDTNKFVMDFQFIGGYSKNDIRFLIKDEKGYTTWFMIYDKKDRDILANANEYKKLNLDISFETFIKPYNFKYNEIRFSI